MTLQARILDYNYAQLDSVDVSASSSDSEFPVSNIQSPIRSKVWRSSGNFEIAAGYKIDFSKGGGQLTATVSAGTYTPTTLAAHIKSILEAADGVNTYTVTFSTSTGLWTIATSGGTLSLLWLTGTNTANTFAPVIGFTVADNTGATTYTGSTIAIHTNEWVLIDTLTAQNIDSFMMFFDAMRGYQFSTNAVLKIQANATNSWSSPAVNVTLTPNSTYEVAANFWTSAQSYRYWRLSIVDPANANLYVEVSKLVLAYATQLSMVPDNGMVMDFQDQSEIERSPYGHEYADVYPIQKKLSINHRALSYSDVQLLHEIYLRLGRSSPLAVAIDPTETLFTKEDFVIYGKITSGHTPTQFTRSIFQQPLEITEVF